MARVSTVVILIVPPSFIRTPSPSAIAVVPLAVPPSIRLISAGVAVIAVSLSAARTASVPPTLGITTVRSAVGSSIVSVVSYSSAVAPSKTIAFAAFIVTVSTIVCVPLTVRFPVTVRLSATVTSEVV